MNQSNTVASPFPFTATWRNLIWTLTRREVHGRYRGANLGMLWSLLQPFLMLGVYSLAFGSILKMKWPGVTSTGDVAVLLFVGLVIHGFLADSMVRAPTLVSGNVNYVKRVVFPLELMPWPVLLSGLFHLALNLMVLAVVLVVIGHPLRPTALLAPLVMLPLVPHALGLLWLLSAIGVFVRDINQLMAPLSTAMLFLSSAIIPVHTLSERLRWVFSLNPLTSVIDAARDVLLFGRLPDWGQLAIVAGTGLVFAWLGYMVFRRLRPGFADAL